MSVKFYITIRKGLIQSLLKLKKYFDIVIYSSLDQEMADSIIDYLEQTIAEGEKIFVHRFHVNSCDILNCETLGIKELKVRSMKIVTEQYQVN